MISRPVIGMKVRILNPERMQEWDNHILTVAFDSSLGDTGILVEIEKLVDKGHRQKVYHVQLDAPNQGRMHVFGTENIEALVD